MLFYILSKIPKKGWDCYELAYCEDAREPHYYDIAVQSVMNVLQEFQCSFCVEQGGFSMFSLPGDGTAELKIYLDYCAREGDFHKILIYGYKEHLAGNRRLMDEDCCDLHIEFSEEWESIRISFPPEQDKISVVRAALQRACSAYGYEMREEPV